MASPTEKLAQSLERLQKLQGERGTSAIRSKDLLRADRERLLKNGFIGIGFSQMSFNIY